MLQGLLDDPKSFVRWYLEHYYEVEGEVVSVDKDLFGDGSKMYYWPDAPDELKKVTLKEIHWLCDGLSLEPKGAFEEHHPKIVV